MFCFKCGAKLSDKAIYCEICGAEMPNKNNGAETAGSKSQTEVLLSEQEAPAPTEVILSEQEAPAPTEVILSEQELSSPVKTEAVFQENNSASSNKTEVISYEQAPQNAAENSSSGSAVRLKPGDILGEIYRVIEEIGNGHFGRVYKAYHMRLQKEIVIKQIYRSEKNISNSTEAKVLKKIKHTYLPQVYDFIEKYGTSFTIMDYISGSDIQKLMSNGRKFSGKEIIKIAVQLCEAVNYLHNCKPPIIHSDIKPENIMLTENGDICLIDMNVSLVFDNDASVIGGTLGYAPPEQFGIPLADIEQGIKGEPPVRKVKPYVNERSDIYSIGAFLRFLVTRKAPSINYADRDIPADTRIPDGLRQIIKKATMLEPSRRFKSVNEMLTALKNIGKLDRRYTAIKVQRAVVTGIAAVLMLGFLYINRAGVRKLAEEHEEKYKNYVSEIESNIESGDFTKAEEIISEATEFEPTRIEPYYNLQKILYANKDYEKCMNYALTLDIAPIKENELNDLNMLAEMYMMAADSAFELEDYENAINLYNETLGYSSLLVDCYRDLTISYARLGDIESAKRSLEKAEQFGISNDRLELMQGEIYAASGEITEAYNCFVNTLEQTDDDYIRFRALLVCDNTLLADTANAKENAKKMIELLNSQKDVISLEYSGIVREMLANEYAVAEDFENAAKCYQGLLDEGQLNYALQKNYFNILFSKLQDYDRCFKLLENMKKQNSEDYWVYMNLSYTCISEQNAIGNQLMRDYSKAYENYKKAAEKYAVYSRDGKTDANMDKLKGLINDLISYGWIEEE